MSLSAATTIGNLANIGLVGSLVIGVISTFLIVRTADVKGRHWDIAREQSRERIAELSMQGDQLRKDTAEAKMPARWKPS